MWPSQQNIWIIKVLPGIKIAGFTHEFRTVQCFLKVKCVTAVSTELKSWAQTSQNIGKIGDKPAEDILRQIWFAVILWMTICKRVTWLGRFFDCNNRMYLNTWFFNYYFCCFDFWKKMFVLFCKQIMCAGRLGTLKLQQDR